MRAHRVPRARRDRSDYLRLDLGESPRPASPKVLQAIRGLEPDTVSHYPDLWPLRSALGRLHSVGEERIAITAGSDEAIRWTFNAFVEEGSRVVIPRPTFGAFLAAAQAGDAFVERVDYSDDLSLDVEEYRRCLAPPRTPRLAVLANPNAPTGTSLPRDTLVGLAAASPETLFLLNESFVTFHGVSVLDGGSAGELPANLLVLRSFSKDYGLAGLRVGYLVGHPSVIDALEIVLPSYTVSASSLRAAEAALTEQDAMRAHVRLVRGVMDRVVAKLGVRGIDAIATRANFVLVKLSSPIQPWAAAFAAHKILVGTDGHAGPMAPYVRITVNTDEEAQRFLDTLDLVLHQGIRGASQVRGVPGSWEDLGGEGMA